MKKFLSILLAALMICSCCAVAFAADTGKTLKFHEDGTFKILQFNDTQDVGNPNGKLLSFMNAALDAENPDLVVFVGDQLSDVYPFANAEDYKEAIIKQLKPLEDRGIPFLVTLGNHDHDRASKLAESDMINLYNVSGMFYGNDEGCDPFTYNVPVLSSDGSKTALNIYMMDSNNKAEEGGYAGINAEQLAWYNETSAALKAANGGEPMPSLLFQHVPPKEIYTLLKECEWNTEGAIYSRRDGKWYVVDETKATGKMGEAPCSEDFDHITGQYQAWLANGDIIGAYFAHDHVNNFVGTTDDGIRMGYNGGSGFRSYGIGGDRSVRVYELNENDLANYTTRLVTYNDIIDPDVNSTFTDFFSPALLTTLMKVVYALFGWAIKLFK